MQKLYHHYDDNYGFDNESIRGTERYTHNYTDHVDVNIANELYTVQRPIGLLRRTYWSLLELTGHAGTVGQLTAAALATRGHAPDRTRLVQL